jgi:hypothetical protein
MLSLWWERREVSSPDSSLLKLSLGTTLYTGVNIVQLAELMVGEQGGEQPRLLAAEAQPWHYPVHSSKKSRDTVSLMKGTGSGDENVLKSSITKLSTFCTCPIGFKTSDFLVKEKNKYKVSAYFKKNTTNSKDYSESGIRI